jgi:hypothetical protein
MGEKFHRTVKANDHYRWRGEELKKCLKCVTQLISGLPSVNGYLKNTVSDKS